MQGVVRARVLTYGFRLGRSAVGTKEKNERAAHYTTRALEQIISLPVKDFLSDQAECSTLSCLVDGFVSTIVRDLVSTLEKMLISKITY